MLFGSFQSLKIFFLANNFVAILGLYLAALIQIFYQEIIKLGISNKFYKYVLLQLLINTF